MRTKKKFKSKSKYKSKSKQRGGRTRSVATKKISHTHNKNHCSPHSLKNAVVTGSCFTKDAINKIAVAYNKQNPENTISDQLSPKHKWMKIKETMTMCDQDKCWLQNLKLTGNDKNLLQTQLFVPPKPSEWKKQPNTWLTNFDIENVLRQYEVSHPNFQFIGPSPIDYDTKPNKTHCVCDKLCNFSVQNQLKMGKKKIGVVFNLDPHNKGGSHWVSMFIDLEDKFVFYFNSTGEKMQPQLKKFKDMVVSQGGSDMDFYTNTFEHQKGNTECGMYSLYFIVTCLLREPDIFKHDETTKMTKEQLITYFTKAGRIPDTLVEGYREEFFRSSSSSSSSSS